MGISEFELSVLKSHFARARSFVLEQLLSKSKKRFVRTHLLQEVLGLSEACEWGLFYLLVSVSFDSEDLKRLRALSPLGQKHAFWIWTGNLSIVQRNDLTTEPRLQIWQIKTRIIAIVKSNCIKNSQPEKHVESHFYCPPTLVLSPTMQIGLGNSNEMFLPGLTLSSTQNSAFHHDLALLQQAMNAVEVCSPQKWKH